ncbi:MAG: PD-(D/E)XK nuclease family protein [Candidatus Eutrophobiaceae bacterium]
MDSQLIQAIKQGAEVIVPVERLARSLLHGYGMAQRAAGIEVWESPCVLSWGAWCAKQWQLCGHRATRSRTLLNGTQQRRLWQKIIAESGDPCPFSHATAAVAMGSYRLIGEYRLDAALGRDPQWQGGDNQDVGAFRRWLETYRKILASRALIDVDALPEALHALIGQSPDGPARLIWYGFDFLTPAQQGIWEALESRGTEVLEWLGTERQAERSRRVFSSKRQEVRAAARWAREALERAPKTRIGVLSLHPAAERDALQNEFNMLLHPRSCTDFAASTARAFSISAGRPLSDYPLIQMFQQILELAHGVLPMSRISALLLSPWLPDAQAEAGRRAELDFRLRRGYRQSVSLAALLGELETQRGMECPALYACLKRLAVALEKTKRRQGAADWAQRFGECLDRVKWSEQSRLASEEYQLVDAWHKSLEALASLEDYAGRLNYREAAIQLEQILADHAFQPETPETPIQIMGFIGAAGMGFDRIWCLGMDDQGWPRPASPDPFLPLAVQKNAALPQATALVQRDYAVLALRNLAQSCGELVFSHALRDGDQQLRPSPLIGPNVPCLDDSGAADEDYSHTVLRARESESFDNEPVPLAADEKIRGGSSIFSDQTECPFRAFARHRLRAYAPEREELMPSARLRGEIVHELMEVCWGQWGDLPTLRVLGDEDIEAQIRQAATEILRAWHRRLPEVFTPALLKLEVKRLLKVVMDMLRIEMERSDFKVISMEKSNEIKFEGLDLRLKIDRVDQLADNSLVVVDYKTGYVQASDWDKNPPRQPQLPLYALVQDAEVAALAFACLRVGEIGFAGYGRSVGILPGVNQHKEKQWDEQLKEWRAGLQSLATGFRAGKAEVNPAPGACQYCDLHALCRIHDQAQGGNDDGK